MVRERCRAEEYRKWEDSVMRAAMERAPAKRPRLRLTVATRHEAAGVQDMNPSMSMMIDVRLQVRLHLEQVMESLPIEVDDSLEQVGESAMSSREGPALPSHDQNAAKDDELDEVNLMQTLLYGRGICTLADLKQWLGSLAYRNRVVGELLNVLRSRQSAMDVCIRYLESVYAPPDVSSDFEGELPKYVEVLCGPLSMT